MAIMNSWEANALQYYYPEGEVTTTTTALATSTTIAALDPKEHVQHPIIYPGLYAPSGFDMMNILIRVISRPNPIINLGPVDASCALLMCDLQQPDQPVVYVNDACEALTGYRQSEILGRNCRFMQAPGGKVRKSSTRKHVDKAMIKSMCRAVADNNELAVEVPNFKKNGQQFTNLLAMIPVYWDSPTPRYSVGFMAEKTW
ncbi:putative vivid protein [Xylariomycetidae sp. FL0641]|nr:putative vivid protein [Xylariomycetidae sp. FL0641]